MEKLEDNWTDLPESLTEVLLEIEEDDDDVPPMTSVTDALIFDPPASSMDEETAGSA